MNWEFCTTATGECFTRKEYFYFGDQLNLCKIPNGCFIVGLIYKKKNKKLFELWLFCIRHRREQSLLKNREGPTQNLTKPSKRRAEKDKTREVVFGLVCSVFLFCFFFNFCFYYVLGDGGSKLDQGSGFFVFFFSPLSLMFSSLYP